MEFECKEDVKETRLTMGLQYRVIKLKLGNGYLVQDHIYIADKKKNQKIYARCMFRRKCSARGVLMVQGQLVEQISNKHNHPPPDVRTLQFRQKMKDAQASSPSTPINRIYKRVCEEIIDEEVADLQKTADSGETSTSVDAKRAEIMRLIPKLTSVKSTLYRQRAVSLAHTHTQQPILCRAAVAWKMGKPLSIEEVEVAAPKEGEVRIKILAASVCQTDALTLRGIDPEARFPCILGHEGGGIVESIGPGVMSLAVEDHVIPVCIPQCKNCKFCFNPKTNLCQKIRVTQRRDFMFDGNSPFSCKGQELAHFMGISTFSEYTVVPEISLAKVDKKAPLDKICLLGCGISTGYGAVINTAKVEAGSTCAVWGLGCVGLAVIMGCKAVGASKIIAIDINPDKEELAKQFGATDFINPVDYDTPLPEVLRAMVEGGLDYTFQCVGNASTMHEAIESSHKGWGVSTVINVAGAGQDNSMCPMSCRDLLFTGRIWRGTTFGGYNSRDDVPKLVNDYLAGKMLVDEFVTHHVNFDNINEAFVHLNAGKGIRTIVHFI